LIHIAESVASHCGIKGDSMRDFELHFIDVDGATVRACNIAARDDLQALEEAERESSLNSVEVWQGSRRVARVKRGNTPLLVTDRTCL
jgi:hypothetical protein